MIETAPGEEAQVDYGSGPMVRDPQNGRYRRTRLFVLTLGYSRKCVRLLVFRSSARVWAEPHEKAFRRLEGKVESASATPRRRRSRGCASKVSKRRRRIWIVGKSAGPTRAFMAPPSAKSPSCSPKSGPRCFRCRSNRSAITRRRRTVHLDGCVEIEAAYYSAPPGWIGRRIHVQWNGTHVRLIDPLTGQLLREHLRQERGRHRIKDEDRPSRTPLSTQQLLARAEKARPAHRRVVPGPASQLRTGRRAQAFWACSRWPRSTASLPPRTPARWRWKPALANTNSCAAIWNTIRNCH